MAQILNGREVSSALLEKVAIEVKALPSDKLPKLVMLLIGDNPASLSYVKQKAKTADKTGVLSELKKYSANITQSEILSEIQNLNEDPTVHGILVQLPLPDHLNAYEILQSIAPKKDVDGLHLENQGAMLAGKKHERLVPCTAKGIIKLLEFYNLPIQGQNVTVIGRSNLVGKSVAALLTNRDATVTICHSKTKLLIKHTRNSDIIIVATGQANLLKLEMLREEAVVIDVGCSHLEDGTLCGDVSPNVADKVAWISPVPGGVGPMTVACLIENTYLASLA